MGASGYEFGVGGAVSTVYVHWGTLLNTPVVVVYAGESSTNFTRECFIILFADAIKRNFQGFDDVDCQIIPRYYLLNGH